MFNKTTILASAESLVGFREDESAEYAALPAELTDSNSGYYFNDLAMVNFEVLRACLSDEQTDMATYCTGAYESAVISVIDRFIRNNKDKIESKELLQNANIVNGIAPFTRFETQNARFVGYLITLQPSDNISVQIPEISFQCEDTQADFKLYLYSTAQSTAIKVIDFDINKAKSMVSVDVTDAIMSNVGYGNSFVLGYFEADPSSPQTYQLQNRALSKEFDCGCSNSPSINYSRYMKISPIEINNEDLDGINLPPVENFADHITNETYGLTFRVNVKCDITKMLVNNISMFAEAIQYAFAVKVLYDAYSSVRINSISDSKRETIKQFAVKYDGMLNGYRDGDGRFVKGIIDTLTADFTSLDWPCLKGSKNKIQVGNMYV